MDTDNRQRVGRLPWRRRVISAVDARQGVISGRVVTVLAASLVFVVAALIVAYFVAR